MIDDTGAKTETELARLLKEQGFAYGPQLLLARTVSLVGLPLAYALVMHESAGQNIWGHDYYYGGQKAPGWGWGAVTEANVDLFLVQRNASGRSNGCGLTQLTSRSLQDECMQAGGLWVPQHQMAVGLHDLHGLIAENGLEAGVAAYNGSGPAAVMYSQEVLALAEHYKGLGIGTVIGNL